MQSTLLHKKAAPDSVRELPQTVKSLVEFRRARRNQM